jgi:hypothetical protein
MNLDYCMCFFHASYSLIGIKNLNHPRRTNLEVPQQWIHFRSIYEKINFFGLLIWVCYKVVSKL